MQQRRCFKPTPKVPLRVARRRDEAPGAFPVARPADSRAAIAAAQAFLRASARVGDAAA